MSDGVHNTHCCKIHGCKYGDNDCPVEFGNLPGIECEICETDQHYPSNGTLTRNALDSWFNSKIDDTELLSVLNKIKEKYKSV